MTTTMIPWKSLWKLWKHLQYGRIQYHLLIKLKQSFAQTIGERRQTTTVTKLNDRLKNYLVSCNELLAGGKDNIAQSLMV